jgi:NTP pyrophosphatase (non-canonical NTP hydrolase)
MPRRTNDPLRDLALSTREFYDRFDYVPQVESAVRNFQEEVAELIEAAGDGTNPDHIAEEAADVFVTAIGVCYASGIDVEKIIQQLYKVVDKNDAKNHDTHVLENGKIRRRVPK